MGPWVHGSMGRCRWRWVWVWVCICGPTLAKYIEMALAICFWVFGGGLGLGSGLGLRGELRLLWLVPFWHFVIALFGLLSFFVAHCSCCYCHVGNAFGFVFCGLAGVLAKSMP